MSDLSGVEKRLECVALVRRADLIDPNTLRIATPFKYPDSSFIDVFVEIEAGLQLQYKVSDLSQSFTWLLDLSISVPKAGRRRAFLRSILNTYGVMEKDGELQVFINDLNELPIALLNVAQAALRISDLMFTQRVSSTTDFNDDFEDFLDLHELSFSEKRFEIRDKAVVIPYFVKSNRVESLIQTLSTKSIASAPKIATDAFVRWYDIRNEMPTVLRVTVFDDRSDIIRQSDLDRLSDLSKVIPWTDRPTLTETLVG